MYFADQTLRHIFFSFEKILPCCWIFLLYKMLSSNLLLIPVKKSMAKPKNENVTSKYNLFYFYVNLALYSIRYTETTV